MIQKFPLSEKTMRRFVLVFLLFFPLLISACKNDEPTEPKPDLHYGLTGTVKDTSGTVLEGVSIYCYFYYPSPNSIPFANNIQLNTDGPVRLGKTAVFDFTFSQNFPNPVYNSTYVRFALPSDSHVELKITRGSSNTFYSYSADCLSGLYQLYLESIVDSLKLKNGPYMISFSARTVKGEEFNAQKPMFVISDKGAPGAVTDSKGQYYFPFNDAFVGDSLVQVTADNYGGYTEYLNNNVNLVVKKNGYLTRVFSASLYSQVLLHYDIIMFKEDKK